MKTTDQPVNQARATRQRGSLSVNPFQLLQLKPAANPFQLLTADKSQQPKFNPIQLLTNKRKNPIQLRPDKTGLPDNLKTGIEQLSGYSMDDVKVHYNSAEPASLQAHAYAQGTDIHIATGQEKHLPHEAWHVVQQKQGRVKPTRQLKGKVNAHANNQATESVQRVLIGAGTFQSVEQIAEVGGVGDYIVLYSEIRESIIEYNGSAEATEVIARLKKLDTLQGKVKLCLQQIAGGEYAVEHPATLRKGHLNTLAESIALEKTTVLHEKTQAKEVLAGPHGVLRAGMPWFFLKAEKWVDASSLLTGEKTIAITITGTEEGAYLFDFTIGGPQKGKIAKEHADLNTKFTPDVSPLFPSGGEPTKEDVQQTNLGDCYLQAALAGLAARKPGFIKEMLFDNGDEVVVRLFRLPGKEPQYIRVKRSKAQTREGVDLYNAGAMWVKMIQKAYAAGNFAGDLSGKRKHLSLLDIAGDMVGYTMGVLTGGDIDSVPADGEDLQSGAKAATALPWSIDVGTLWSYLEDDEEIPSPETDEGKECKAALDLLNPMFGSNAEQIKTWAKFADSNRDKLDTFRTLEQFTEFFEEKTLNAEVAAIIMVWIRKSGFYRGAVGTGIYSNGQLAVLKKVEEALGAGKLLAVGTKKVLSTDEDQALGGSGEPKYKGLAGGHAYTILNVRKARTADPASEEPGKIHWIQLRNPWGKYGRSYAEDWAPVAIEEGGGVFWVELTDLAKNFSDIDII